MSANLFGNRFYGNREPAWHNLGHVSQEDRGAQEALSIIGSYWIEKRPVTILLNGEDKEVGDYALVRSATPDDPKEEILGYCTKNYNILQPDKIAEIFDDKVNQPVETVGMLGKGEKIFLTWKLPKIDVSGDEVQTFGFVASGHDGKFGSSLSIVTTRVVCQNTFSIALHESESKAAQEAGRGRMWVGKHNSTHLERDLGIWMEHIQQRAESKCNELSISFNQMQKCKIEDTETLANLLFQIYPDPAPIPVDFPEKLREEKQEKVDQLAEKAANDRTLVESLFSGNGTAIDATGWGLFNSCTEYENWGRDTRKSADYSIVAGNRAKQMNIAYSVIDYWAKNTQK